MTTAVVPLAHMPSPVAAFRNSPASGITFPYSSQQLSYPQPSRLLHPRSPWLPQQGGSTPPQPPSRASQTRAAHTPSARGPGPDPPAPQSRAADGGRGGWVHFFATCHPGLEQVVARELLDLGYTGVEPSKAGVAFRGRRVSDGYAANLWLRSAIRVLVLLAEGELGADPRVGVRGGQALYDMVYEAAPWHEIIPEGQTFSVEPRLWLCTDISSTRLVWSRVKDAVCDSIRRYRRDKPSPPERGEVADVPLYVSCYRDRVRIFRDMSGNSLHRRGYRDVMHRAALNEAAAAGVLALSGWREAVEEAVDGEGLVLADPMCGSGTLLIEAALIARDIAPGFMRSLALDQQPAAPAAPAAAGGNAAGRSRGGGRRGAPLAADAWPFQRWTDYDASAWGQAMEEARERVRPPWRGRLLGVDVHEGAMSLAVRQAKKAGVYDMLELSLGDCGEVTPAATPSLVVCNPPWGARLDGDFGGGDGDDDGGGLYDNDGDGFTEDGDDGHLGVVPRDVAAAAAAGGRRAGRFGGGGGGDGPAAAAPEQEAFLAAAWRSLDGFLYRQCPGASATVVSGNSAAFRYLKLKPQSKHRLVLSGVDVQVASYKIRDAASRISTAAAALPPAEPLRRAAEPRAVDDSSFVSQPAAHAAAAEAAAGGVAPPRLPPLPPPLPPSPSTRSSSTTAVTSTARPLTEGAADPVGAARAGTAAPAAAAARRRAGPPPPPPPPPPTQPGDYLDADDGYWVN